MSVKYIRQNENGTWYVEITDKKGNVLEEGSVKIDESKITRKKGDIVPNLETGVCRHGKWFTFYLPFNEKDKSTRWDRLCREENYVNGHAEGEFIKYYSPEQKPKSYGELPKQERGIYIFDEEQGKSVRHGTVVTVSMDGIEHRCIFEKGHMRDGIYVGGYGHRWSWFEDIVSFKKGCLLLRETNVYTRNLLETGRAPFTRLEHKKYTLKGISRRNESLSRKCLKEACKRMEYS